MRLMDFTGKEFGCVKVVKRIGSNHHGAALWDCVCTCGCGTHKAYASSALITMGDRKHPRKCLSWSHHTSHGGADSRLYQIWQAMKYRCSNPKASYYHCYGGRGIKVCDEWQNSFEAFQEWALANGYDENAPQGKCTIDRIDNDGNYEPSNCRWVDGHTQNMNRRVKKTDIRPQLERVNKGEITQKQAIQELGIRKSTWDRLRREIQGPRQCDEAKILEYIEKQERKEITVEQALKELKICTDTWYRIKKARNQK